MTKKKVSVSFITYNQEKFVVKAIESVLMQRTDFEFELVIGEDASTDATGEICLKYERQHPATIRVLQRSTNLGAVRNFLETYKACEGEYVAYLEGDDYWTDRSKLQKQVDFLDRHPDFSICCHHVDVVDEGGDNLGRLLQDQPEVTTVHDLCRGDYISTASCMVRNKILDEIPGWIYTLPGCDWPFDILHAEKGKIMFLPETMAVYGRHAQGIWSGKDEIQQLKQSLELTEKLNSHLGYRYDSSFKYRQAEILHDIVSLGKQSIREYAEQLVVAARLNPRIQMLMLDEAERDRRELLNLPPPKKKKVRERISAELKRSVRRLRGYRGSTIGYVTERLKPKPELVVLDDIFPNPLSGFRMQEFHSYFSHFGNMKIYSLGAPFGGYDQLHTMVSEYEARFPANKGLVEKYQPKARIAAKLVYTIFLGNAWRCIDCIDRSNVPFVFTLYPGGSFCLNNRVSDAKLARVTSSPCFRKVIVSQKLTYDYLIDKGFCKPEQVEFIFGVVTPLESLNRSYPRKRYLGKYKDTLDICFVAHRYTERGTDKGYDVFLDVARILSAKYDNIVFHVVGGFDETTIPIDGINDRVRFYGYQRSDWFENFYMDKDIILTPNVPFKVFDGGFDGFPTGCTTDACLHKVAMFCTDMLKLNTEFKDGEEIVIVPHDAGAIAKIIEGYYKAPDSLAALAERGYQRARELYSFERQIRPRIEVLEKIIGQT